MSATKFESIKVIVKGGDAISSNRIKGKSNTGTYFISSIKDWDEFKSFFNDASSIEYFLDKKRVLVYKNDFVKYFFDRRSEYPDEMRNFEDICDSLLMCDDNTPVEVNIRNNDNRYFMRFANNTNDIERCIRGILYSELSYIVFVKSKNGNFFYPEINMDLIGETNNG